MSPKHQPLIGLTGSIIHDQSGSQVVQVGQAYITAIQQAGGLPTLIPAGFSDSSLSELVSRLDGVLFTGGTDIDPARFNGQPHPKVFGLSPERDTLEFALLEKALAARKPLLAICRGIQILNVGLGGSLYTHILDQMEGALKHDWFPNYPRDKRAHSVNINRGCQLAEIVNAEEIWVNSLHHQGIDRLGESLEAIGFAPDGLVEAVAVKGADFALGVQWHPECLPDDPHAQALFRAFIEAC